MPKLNKTSKINKKPIDPRKNPHSGYDERNPTKQDIKHKILDKPKPQKPS